MNKIHYAVTSFVDGLWTTRRYTRMSDALRFANKETKRLQIGISVHRVHPDGSDFRYTGVNWVKEN
jgi:hypothetical protein